MFIDDCVKITFGHWTFVVSGGDRYIPEGDKHAGVTNEVSDPFTGAGRYVPDGMWLCVDVACLFYVKHHNYFRYSIGATACITFIKREQSSLKIW